MEERPEYNGRRVLLLGWPEEEGSKWWVQMGEAKVRVPWDKLRRVEVEDQEEVAATATQEGGSGGRARDDYELDKARIATKRKRREEDQKDRLDFLREFARQKAFARVRERQAAEASGSGQGRAG